MNWLRGEHGIAGIIALEGFCLAFTGWWNKHGATKPAAKLLVSSLLIFGTLIVITAPDGARSPAILIFPAMLAVAGLLVTQQFLFYAGAGAALVAILGVADWMGWIGRRPGLPVTPAYLVSVLSILVAMAFATGKLAASAAQNLA